MTGRPHDRLDVLDPDSERPVSGLAVLVGTVGASLRGRDLTVVAAGLTYFSGIALVPWLLLSVWTATLVGSPAAVAAHAADLSVLVPPEMGGRPVYERLIDAGMTLGPLGALVALFPASFYGEGLRRACLRVVPRPDRFTGWRARATLLPLVLASPLLTQAVLLGAPLMADLTLRGGLLGTLGRVVVSFHISWIVIGLVLVWAFRVVAPGAPGGRALLLGAFGTSAVLSGFLQGFVVFLALPIDLGVPFAGLDVVGAVVAVGLWLFVLHTVLLVGWTTTVAADRLLAGDRSVAPLAPRVVGGAP